MKCKHCSSEFTPSKDGQRFCSTKCRVYSARGIKHKDNPMKASTGGKRFNFRKSVKGGLGGEVGEGSTCESEGAVKPDHPDGKPWLSPERLKYQPMVLETGMPKSELMMVLRGGRKFAHIESGGISGYNRYMLEIGMPWRCVTVQALETMLARSGYDYRLASGVGCEPPDSEFLKSIANHKKQPALPD